MLKSIQIRYEHYLASNIMAFTFYNPISDFPLILSQLILALAYITNTATTKLDAIQLSTI